MNILSIACRIRMVKQLEKHWSMHAHTHTNSVCLYCIHTYTHTHALMQAGRFGSLCKSIRRLERRGNNKRNIHTCGGILTKPKQMCDGRESTLCAVVCTATMRCDDKKLMQSTSFSARFSFILSTFGILIKHIKIRWYFIK